MATILDLQDIFILEVDFDGFIRSVIVKPLDLDTKIMTVSTFLEKLEQFSYIPNRHGSHLGGHLEFLKLLVAILD